MLLVNDPVREGNIGEKGLGVCVVDVMEKELRFWLRGFGFGKLFVYVA